MIINAVNLNSCWLGKYWNAIQEGKEIVGLEMYLEINNLIDDICEGKYVYDTRDADIRIDFIENCIRLTKDPFYGKPMILQLFQKAWIEAFYSFKFLDDTTKDRFFETLLLITRKNGKSELASALIVTEFILGGYALDIVCGSNDEAQACILYDSAWAMLKMIDPEQVDVWKNQKKITCLLNQNSIYKMTVEKKNKEGYNISFAVLDEVHEMKNNKLYKPIQQSAGVKTRFKSIIITTEGFVNGGLLDELLIEYRKIIHKTSKKRSDERRLPWLYTQDSEKEIFETDENGVSLAWKKSSPSLGVIKQWDYLRDQVDDAKASKKNRPFVLAKDFNWKVNSSETWLLKDEYEYVIEHTINNDRYVGIGAVDLSETTDMTSAKIYLFSKDDNRKIVLSHYWIPQSKLTESNDKDAGAQYLEWSGQNLLTICDGNRIDLSLVADWFFEMSEKYNIYFVKFGYDRKFKTDWVKRMEYYGWNDGEDLYEVLQTPERLHDHIFQVQSDLKHRNIIGLNEIDKWCLGNAALKISNNGKYQLVKVDGKKSFRIDGAMSLVICEATYDYFRTDVQEQL